VTGKEPPETEKPVPVIESELIVAATVPLDVTVTDFVTAVPTATLPNASDVALTLSVGTAPLSCKATLFEELFALAVIVAVCVVLTEAMLAVNATLAAPAATVTALGNVTALLLLARLTMTPVLGAFEVSEAVQLVVPAPVKELLPHESALTPGSIVDPVALSLIVVDFELDPRVAVTVIVCATVTADTVAMNVALVPPPGTLTEAGTANAAPLLVRVTTDPPLGAAEPSVTVHESEPAPVSEELTHLSPEMPDPEEPLP
jgi:hypothetical protein